VDITDPSLVQALVMKTKPEIIIHAAGLNGLASCEGEPNLARKINVGGTKNVITAILKVNPATKLVFISSDYVFDGKGGNYKEDTPRNPQTVYGETKVQSENEIRRRLQNYLIVRTANVYGRGGTFFNFVLDNLENGRAEKYFTDTFYTPTYIEYLTNSIKELLAIDYRGVIHLAGSERVSRYQFALKAANALGKNQSLVRPVRQPTGGLIAKDSSLNTALSQRILRNPLPNLEKSLHYCFGNLIPPYFYFQDARGLFRGIMRGRRWDEINFVESRQGSVRGNHYHRQTIEAFYIIDGRIKVHLTDLSQDTTREFIVEGGDSFIIKPNILHIFDVLKDSRWINLLSQAMGEKEKDIIKI
jgi:dTDP-4-dehydrorhamnose reductase